MQIAIVILIVIIAVAAGFYIYQDMAKEDKLRAKIISEKERLAKISDERRELEISPEQRKANQVKISKLLDQLDGKTVEAGATITYNVAIMIASETDSKGFLSNCNESQVGVISAKKAIELDSEQKFALAWIPVTINPELTSKMSASSLPGIRYGHEIKLRNVLTETFLGHTGNPANSCGTEVYTGFASNPNIELWIVEGGTSGNLLNGTDFVKLKNKATGQYLTKCESLDMSDPCVKGVTISDANDQATQKWKISASEANFTGTF